MQRQDPAPPPQGHREGRALGDTTTLVDPTVVARLEDDYEAKEG